MGACVRKCFWKLFFCKSQGAGLLDHLLEGNLEGKIRHQEAKSKKERISAVALEWKWTAMPRLLSMVHLVFICGLWVCPGASRDYTLHFWSLNDVRVARQIYRKRLSSDQVTLPFQEKRVLRYKRCLPSPILSNMRSNYKMLTLESWFCGCGWGWVDRRFRIYQV